MSWAYQEQATMEHNAARRANQNVTKAVNVVKRRRQPQTKTSLKECRLTADQDDDASGHCNARLLRLVVSSTVGALHSHAGYTQAGHRYNNADNHEGAGCLEGTWARAQERVSPAVIVTITGTQGKRVWQHLKGHTGLVKLFLFEWFMWLHISVFFGF